MGFFVVFIWLCVYVCVCLCIFVCVCLFCPGSFLTLAPTEQPEGRAVFLCRKWKKSRNKLTNLKILSKPRWSRADARQQNWTRTRLTRVLVQLSLFIFEFTRGDVDVYQLTVSEPTSAAGKTMRNSPGRWAASPGGLKEASRRWRVAAELTAHWPAAGPRTWWAWPEPDWTDCGERCRVDDFLFTNWKRLPVWQISC